MKTERILVTGAAGFIGSHVSEAFLRRGVAVVGLDNFDPFYPREIKERNLADVRHAATQSESQFTFIEGDFCEPEVVARACEGVTGVVHLGAKAGVRPSIEDPRGYVRANLTGTSTILDAAHRAGAQKLVVASSSSVYGNSGSIPFSETSPATEPISPYAATKRATELLGYSHWHLTRQPVAMLRFFTVYGPRQRPDLAISLFLDRVGKEQAIRLFGDGSSSRDYTYIDDIVHGVLSAYDSIADHGYRVWNLGSDQPTSLSDLVATVSQVVGKEPIIERAPMQPGDVERTWADLARSRAELNYNPATRLRDGVQNQWDWMNR